MGQGAYSFSYGYRTSNNQYRTIMAYAPGTRIKVFSGPASQWAGFTMGNSSADNARSHNNTASTAAAWRNAPVASAPVLTVSNLVGGSAASLGATNCTPGGIVRFAYSVFGGGPTPTFFGTALLTQPFTVLPAVIATTSGQASYSIAVPAAAVGRAVWFQTLDLGLAAFSNGVQQTIR